MKIINLDSRLELTQAQISFAESVINSEPSSMRFTPLSFLMNEVPVFLLMPDSMPYEERNMDSEKPPTEYFGFYQHSAKILGIERPAIGLCPERIKNYVKNDEEFMILIAKVIIHEFAHAVMSQPPKNNYQPRDEFYQWMEESMANLITLEYFDWYNNRYKYRLHGFYNLTYKTSITNSLNFVKDFISKQPDNYRLGLDLFQNKFGKMMPTWLKWRNNKKDIQLRSKEKQDWLSYVAANVGKTDRKKLKQLFDNLFK